MNSKYAKTVMRYHSFKRDSISLIDSLKLSSVEQNISHEKPKTRYDVSKEALSKKSHRDSLRSSTITPTLAHSAATTPSLQPQSTQSTPQCILQERSVPMEQDIPIYLTSTIVGFYIGNGINNGLEVWEGIRKGLFIRNQNDDKPIYIEDKKLVKFYL